MSNASGLQARLAGGPLAVNLRSQFGYASQLMMHLRPLAVLPLAVLVVLWVAVSPARAIKTSYWTQSTTEDFRRGSTENVAVTNHGELRLSRQLKTLLPQDKPVTAVQALAEAPDGSIVFSTYPDNKVKRYKAGQIETLAKLDDQMVTALTVLDNGDVLVGVTGEKGRVLRLKPGVKPEPVFENDDVHYIWAIVPANGKLLLATGPESRVYEVDGKNTRELAHLAGNNVLSMITSPDGTIYAGTDVEGHVYRIDPKNPKPFLLYDAAEADISALAIDAKGNLLVATGESKEAQPGEGKTPVGRPEAEKASSIPNKTPAAPKQPDRSEPGEAIPHDATDAPATGPSVAAIEPPRADHNTAGPTPPSGAAEATAGNAIYRIDPRGFVTEVFRENCVIYGMAVQGDSVLLATGEQGEVQEIHPDAEESATLVRTDAAQVTAILRVKSGEVYLGLSNVGQLAVMSAEHAMEGAYESMVFDAGVASAFGTMQLRGQLPEGASLQVSTRSGNAADPRTGGWSDWSAFQPAKEFLPAGAPAARYFQYRLKFTTTDAKKSPSLDEVAIAYQKPNVAPRISSVMVTKANDPANPGNLTIGWDASDPNEDSLIYSVYVRTIGRGGWVELAKETQGNTFTWPGKSAPDGRYEVKVVGSDAGDNQPGEGKEASRVSDVVIIDNTPPVIGDLKVEPAGAEQKVTLRVVDRAGVVAALDYSVDRADHWQRRLPDDTMADSPEERYTIALKDLAKGPHTLTVRATDERGNTSFETVSVNVP
jgi:hypothetical protein